MRLRQLVAPLLAVPALAFAGVTASADEAPVAPTEQVLLTAPDPAGPTTRGVFLSDPDGQIEHLTAIGHLVVWTVRTPADTSRPANSTNPKTLPATTRVVIVDERGGAPLTVDFPGRWIFGLRAFRGPTGPADPQIAVRSCTDRKASDCTFEVLSISADAPLTLRSRTTDRFSGAAFAGRIDSGRRLVVGKRPGRGKHRACVPQLAVRHLSAGDDRQLPKLPLNRDYDHCYGLSAPFIHGRYAFATVAYYSTESGVAASFIYGIDLDAGKRARWRELRRISAESEYTDDDTIGPGITDDALYFELAFTEETTAVSLAQIVLPRDVQRAPIAGDPVEADPISSATAKGCAIAATDDAIYELTNPRCSFGAGSAGQIRRVVHPEFKPADA